MSGFGRDERRIPPNVEQRAGTGRADSDGRDARRPGAVRRVRDLRRRGRLAARGRGPRRRRLLPHDRVGRRPSGRPSTAGMRLVHLRAAPRRSLETLSHTALSVGAPDDAPGRRGAAVQRRERTPAPGAAHAGAARGDARRRPRVEAGQVAADRAALLPHGRILGRPLVGRADRRRQGDPGVLRPRVRCRDRAHHATARRSSNRSGRSASPSST